jgi:GNAT superfamily N-acetyltransferase
VFEGDLSAEDWEHALGGIHALVWDGEELIGHASVVQRRLLHGGRALRAGYVEGVGVRADRRGRGHGAGLMAALERVIAGAYDLGALGATDAAADFYVARGWRRWTGPTCALTRTGSCGPRTRTAASTSSRSRPARPVRAAHVRLARRGRVVTQVASTRSAMSSAASSWAA